LNTAPATADSWSGYYWKQTFDDLSVIGLHNLPAACTGIWASANDVTRCQSDWN